MFKKDMMTFVLTMPCACPRSAGKLRAPWHDIHRARVLVWVGPLRVLTHPLIRCTPLVTQLTPSLSMSLTSACAACCCRPALFSNR